VGSELGTNRLLWSKSANRLYFHRGSFPCIWLAQKSSSSTCISLWHQV